MLTPNEHQLRNFTTSFVNFDDSNLASVALADNSQIGQSSSPFDPASLIFAMSSRLPTVESGSLFNETSPASDSYIPCHPRVPSASDQTGLDTHSRDFDEKKIVKVTWWRPHGQTAIAPGTFGLAYPQINL